MSLTPKQEAFAQAYIETGNASEAYRRAYDAGQMKDATVNRKAKELMDNGKITARLDELRAALVERHQATMDDIATMLREDREFARKCETPAAAVSATMGLAKLYGYLRDKVEHTGKDGKELPAATPVVAIFALPDNGRDKPGGT
ncbi:MAG: hypothetical protein RLZZ475_2874 [Pseudomonadota bacterium]|jgi:phage terminase small subunit